MAMTKVIRSGSVTRVSPLFQISVSRQINPSRALLCRRSFGATNPESDKASTLSQLSAKREGWVNSVKESKALFVARYGVTAILIHELLGVASYAITFSLVEIGIIDKQSVASFFGWTDEDLQKYGVDMKSKIVSAVLTAAIVKSLDLMGLVPLRWALTLVLTPIVAKYFGASINKSYLFLKQNLFGRFKRAPKKHRKLKDRKLDDVKYKYKLFQKKKKKKKKKKSTLR
eukprot:TRINITY_DN1228_c0_g1_i2.p1 TRINITY_DN1228_c0_g1~~TRINITY_DN1228_c0_g1_i2.p1  ORF type:complete len:258 (+),score=44.60 TRINITY_DN1228_c0_g1_i2:90-776(+)